jgi:hypothetical protein
MNWHKSVGINGSFAEVARCFEKPTAGENSDVLVLQATQNITAYSGQAKSKMIGNLTFEVGDDEKGRGGWRKERRMDEAREAALRGLVESVN